MTMGRKAFLSSVTLGLGGLLSGCSPQFGPGGTGTSSQEDPGPVDAAEVLELGQVAELPEAAEPTISERDAPQGYEWAREVGFSAPGADVDAWLEESFGSADVAVPVLVLNPAVAKAFDVDDVPETWRSLRRSVEGAPLELMLLIDDAEPTAVRLHLRRRED